MTHHLQVVTPENFIKPSVGILSKCFFQLRRIELCRFKWSFASPMQHRMSFYWCKLKILYRINLLLCLYVEFVHSLWCRFNNIYYYNKTAYRTPYIDFLCGVSPPLRSRASQFFVQLVQMNL